MRRVLVLAVTSVLAAMLSVSPGSASQRAADDEATLPPTETDQSPVVSLAPLTLLSDLVLDRERRRLFAGGDVLLRMRPDGSRKTIVRGVGPVAGIALAPDGQVVVAEHRGTDLVVVDPAAARTVRRVPVGVGPCVTDVTATAGRYVFSYGCVSSEVSQTPRLGMWDPATGRVTLDLVQPPFYDSDRIRVAAVPQHPGRVVAYGEQQVYRVDIDLADPSRTVRSKPLYDHSGWDVLSLVVDATGDTMVLQEIRGVGPAYTPAYSVDTFEEVDRWPDRHTGALLRAVALGPDGRLVTGADATYTSDLTVYPPLSRSPSRRIDFGDEDSVSVIPHNGVVTDGVELDGDHAVVVLDSIYDRYLGLRRVDVGDTVPFGIGARTRSRGAGYDVRLAVVGRPGAAVDLYVRTARTRQQLVRRQVADERGLAEFVVRPDVTSTYEARTSPPPSDGPAQRDQVVIAVPAYVAAGTAEGPRPFDVTEVEAGTRVRLYAQVHSANPGSCVAWTIAAYRAPSYQQTTSTRRCTRLDDRGRAVLVLPKFRRGDALSVLPRFLGGPDNSASQGYPVRLEYVD